MRALFDWWVRQLSDLIPGSLRTAAAAGRDALILEADADADAVRVLIRRKGNPEFAMKVRAGEVGMGEIARMLASRRDLPPLLVLRFPGLNVLHKRLSFAIAAESRLGTLLGYEMDRETPFDPDEVYWSYRVRRRDVARGRVDVD